MKRLRFNIVLRDRNSITHEQLNELECALAAQLEDLGNYDCQLIEADNQYTGDCPTCHRDDTIPGVDNE